MTRFLHQLVVALGLLVGRCFSSEPHPGGAPGIAGAVDAIASAFATDDLLAHADSVTMEVEFRGCFHFSRHRLVLVPDGDAAHVRLTNDTASMAIDPEHAWTAPARLDAVQLDGIARLLAHYRRPNEGGCTSSTTVLVTTHHPGLPPLRERLHDATCTVSDVPGVLALHEVIRFQPAYAR